MREQPRRTGRLPNWRRLVRRILVEGSTDAAATLARMAKLGDVAAARAILELADRLDPPHGRSDR